MSTEAYYHSISRLAVRALLEEARLPLKPGLVAPRDNGSHRDMDYPLLVRSAFSLRHAFCRLAKAGAAGASFDKLRQIGLAGEAQMLARTGGINTHRGALFSIGLLAAAAGSGDAAPLGEIVRCRWGAAIESRRSLESPGKGALAAARAGLPDARAQAACGFPLVYHVGLPAYCHALKNGANPQTALLHTFYSLLAETPDTNLLHRGGLPALLWAQAQAKEFLQAGSIFTSDWKLRAADIHRAFVQRNLSPGGTADLLSATLFVYSFRHP